jgi:hypothetical protein
VYGSNYDGWNFTEIPQASMMNRISTANYSNYQFYKSVVPVPDAFLYLGFVFNKLAGGVVGNNLLAFDDLILYGTEYLDGWAQETKCARCPAGTYANASASTTCTKCAAGTYSATTGATACARCPANTYADATTGATACVGCPAHAHGPAAASSAFACTCEAGFACRYTKRVRVDIVAVVGADYDDSATLPTEARANIAAAVAAALGVPAAASVVVGVADVVVSQDDAE